MNDQTPIPRLALTVEEAAASTGLSRTRIYEAAREKRLTVRKDGRATVVEIEELRRYLSALPTRGRQPGHRGLTHNNIIRRRK
jgi:excisionase family DNA binding protein